VAERGVIGSGASAVVFDYYETLAKLSTSIRERFFDGLARRVGAYLPPGEAFRHWRERIVSDQAVRLGGQQRPSPEGPTPPFVSFRDTWQERFGDLFNLWRVDASAEWGADAYSDLHAGALLYPDVKRTLANLRGRYRLGLLADADRDFLEAGLHRNKLAFDAIVTSEEVRAYKPHISMFRAVREQLDIEPGESVYVGDRPWADIEGARHAGMIAVWMNRTRRSWPEDLDPPPAVVTSLDEVVDLLGSTRGV
jgi:2-haloalkanoic acid dehalogenase type II